MVTAETLKTSQMFSELEDEDLHKILPLCHEEQYAKGSLIFCKGDEAKTVYVLKDGKVRLRYEICPQPDACQDTAILLDKPGDVICWSALVKPRRLTARAHCISDVRVIAIDGTGMNELMEQDNYIGFAVMKELAGLISQRLKEAKGLELGRTMGAL